MKIISNGVIKFEKRVIKKVTMPRMTSPASNFVVDPQRGEDAESCAMIFSPDDVPILAKRGCFGNHKSPGTSHGLHGVARKSRQSVARVKKHRKSLRLPMF